MEYCLKKESWNAPRAQQAITIRASILASSAQGVKLSKRAPIKPNAKHAKLDDSNQDPTSALIVRVVKCPKKARCLVPTALLELTTTGMKLVRGVLQARSIVQWTKPSQAEKMTHVLIARFITIVLEVMPELSDATKLLATEMGTLTQQPHVRAMFQ
jgi:hypothetical protein